MTTTSLQFKDLFELLEFIEITKNHHCHADPEKLIIIGAFTEADIELALRGYAAQLIEGP